MQINITKVVTSVSFTASATIAIESMGVTRSVNTGITSASIFRWDAALRTFTQPLITGWTWAYRFRIRTLSAGSQSVTASVVYIARTCVVATDTIPLISAWTGSAFSGTLINFAKKKKKNYRHILNLLSCTSAVCKFDKRYVPAYWCTLQKVSYYIHRYWLSTRRYPDIWSRLPYSLPDKFHSKKFLVRCDTLREDWRNTGID